MSYDFTKDYSDHELLDSKNKYTKLYKLLDADADEIHKGDLVLLKTACERYGIFVAVADTSDDNTLHLSKFFEADFIKFDEVDY